MLGGSKVVQVCECVGGRVCEWVVVGEEMVMDGVANCLHSNLENSEIWSLSLFLSDLNCECRW